MGEEAWGTYQDKVALKGKSLKEAFPQVFNIFFLLKIWKIFLKSFHSFSAFAFCFTLIFREFIQDFPLIFPQVSGISYQGEVVSHTFYQNQ